MRFRKTLTSALIAAIAGLLALTGCKSTDTTPADTFTVTGAPGESVRVTVFGRDGHPGNFVDGPVTLDEHGKYSYTYGKDWSAPEKIVAIRLDSKYANIQLGCSTSVLYQGHASPGGQPDTSLGPQAKVSCLRTS